MSITEQRDWHSWHDEYDAQGSELSVRLGVVQDEFRKVLPKEPGADFRFVSICAGQAHDIIGVLAGHQHASRVQGRLVELNPENVAKIRAKALDAGLQHLEVIEGDAADTSLYEGAVPADLVIAVGIFGNISDEDVLNTIRALPQFAKPGATVVWSRGRQIVPDITPQIRQAFTDAGFTETAFHAPDGRRFQIGANRYDGHPVPLAREHLFTFRR